MRKYIHYFSPNKGRDDIESSYDPGSPRTIYERIVQFDDREVLVVGKAHPLTMHDFTHLAIVPGYVTGSLTENDDKVTLVEPITDAGEKRKLTGLLHSQSTQDVQITFWERS